MTSPPTPSSNLVSDPTSLPLLLPVPKAAQLLGISRAAAYRLAANGELPVRRLGGRVYVVTAKLLDLVDAA
jgi:excisionase family DNA binding protein